MFEDGQTHVEAGFVHVTCVIDGFRVQLGAVLFKKFC